MAYQPTILKLAELFSSSVTSAFQTGAPMSQLPDGTPLRPDGEMTIGELLSEPRQLRCGHLQRPRADGEMVVLDGVRYQAQCHDGSVSLPDSAPADPTPWSPTSCP